MSKDNVPAGEYGSAQSSNAPFYNKEVATGPASDIHIRYSYAAWNSSVPEPNNAKGRGEGCLSTAIDASGDWNDAENVSVAIEGYTIEYGDMRGGTARRWKAR